MRKSIGWLFASVLLIGAVSLIYESSQSAPPDPDEIHDLFGNNLPGPETHDPPELTERRHVRGWEVWIGNYPRYERSTGSPIAVRRDPEDRLRQLRTFRAASSPGARARYVWQAITGNVD